METLEQRSDRARYLESTRDIYEALTTGSDPEQAPFPLMKDVFMYAACIGFKKGIRRPLPPGKKEGIRMDVFSERDLNILKGIALAETGDIHALERKAAEPVSGQVLNIAEEYAQAGMEELRIILNKPGYILMNLVDQIKQP